MFLAVDQAPKVGNQPETLWYLTVKVRIYRTAMYRRVKERAARYAAGLDGRCHFR